MHCADLVRSSLTEMTEAIEVLPGVSALDCANINELCESAFEAVNTIVSQIPAIVFHDRTLADSCLCIAAKLLWPSEKNCRRHIDAFEAGLKARNHRAGASAV